MSRRFCGLVLCGFAGLTAGLATNTFGDDFRTIQHEVLGDGHPDHHAGNPEFRPIGTIGQTYTRVSHEIPIDKHPRTAMLAVKDNGTIPYLTVNVMGGIKMKNGIWLFESTRPLDPGVCQIVRVEARETPQDVEAYAIRFVRLIPGRIVYLAF